MMLVHASLAATHGVAPQKAFPGGRKVRKRLERSILRSSTRSALHLPRRPNEFKTEAPARGVARSRFEIPSKMGARRGVSGDAACIRAIRRALAQTSSEGRGAIRLTSIHPAHAESVRRQQAHDRDDYKGISRTYDQEPQGAFCDSHRHSPDRFFSVRAIAMPEFTGGQCQVMHPRAHHMEKRTLTNLCKIVASAKARLA